MDGFGFTRTGRLEFREEVADVLFVAGGVFGGEKNGAARKSGLDCVQARFRFALGRARAGGEFRVGAVGGELEGGRGECAEGMACWGEEASPFVALCSCFCAERSAARRTWRGVMGLNACSWAATT